MPKFAIAYINFPNTEMKMEIIEAEDERIALIITLQHHGIELVPADFEKDEEELKQFAFDCDSMIGAIQLP